MISLISSCDFFLLFLEHTFIHVLHIMIEVKARLLRGSVYLAGETVSCEVVFTHVAKPNGTVFHSTPLSYDTKSRKCYTETLAWASAQIHCQCTANASRVVWHSKQKTQDEITAQNNSCTSFIPSRGERGHCVFSTKPTILFCDLSLAPGESKTYIYQETIPYDVPPSYRGSAVRYSHKVAIGTGRLQGSTKFLKLPLRVLVFQGLSELQRSISDRESPSNPFLQETAKQSSLLDVAVDVLTVVSSRRNPHVYNVTSRGGSLGKFCLFKPTYRIGEEIVGNFDFTGSVVPCVKFTVTLQCEETIHQECLASSKTSATSYTSYSHQSEFCLHAKKTHIILPIPVSVTPDFTSDQVNLKWRLHFEFVISHSSSTSEKPEPSSSSSLTNIRQSSWTGPTELDIDTMTWDLPVKIVSTNPLQLSSVSILKSSNMVCF